jgi:hypothetical protein
VKWTLRKNFKQEVELALYKITEKATGTAKLVKAQSAQSALAHMTRSMFEVETVDNPAAAAEMMDQGIRFESASSAPDQGSKDDAPTNQESTAKAPPAMAEEEG